MNLRTALFGILVFQVSAFADERIKVEKLEHAIFSARTTGGQLEYEFQANGTLISYSFVDDGTISRPDFARGEVYEPRFRVDFLAWKLIENTLTIYRGSEKSVSEIFEDKDGVYFNELTWHRAKKVEFFERLFKETGKSFIEQQSKE